MICSSITISLVEEAKNGGPFVFWEDLDASCVKAAQLGYDGVEVFMPSPDFVEPAALGEVLARYGLRLAAMGTGAGWLLHRLRLTDPDHARRVQAREFIEQMIDFAGPFGAPVIIGSMQGRLEQGIPRAEALEWLAHALNELAGRARRHNVPLLFEPLNRYETNLINRLEEGVDLLKRLTVDNVRLLADLFHMNIEEVSIPAALRAAGRAVGHLHFVDSNRRPAGLGHIDLPAVAAALNEIGFDGYASAEALPYPSADEAAYQTMAAFKKCFRPDAASPS